MNDKNSIFFFRDSAVRRIDPAGRLAGAGRRVVASTLMFFLVPLSIGDVYATAQDAPPPPPDYTTQQGAPYQALAPEELDRMVAPIALYPDSLVAQTLAAATYPAQVASAEQFMRQAGGAPPEQIAQQADQQPWDPSVKALTAFPQVLSNLNQNMQWTTELGNAYYNQPQDVMEAVQAMRQRAYEAGNLRRSEQLNVVYNPGAIVIEPVSPAVVYVPYYDPWAVYGPPIRPWGYYHYYGPPAGVALGVGLAIGFGVGVAIGAFGHFGWGYHSWAPNWGARTVVYQHNTYISNSVTVVNHGNYGGFDRNPQARAFNHGEAARFANVNHTTINNVSINRTNINNNRTNLNTFNNRSNYNSNNTRIGTPAQPGQFNSTHIGTPAQPGQFNGARPGQQPGNFNRGNASMQPGQLNSTRSYNQPGQFNSARPGQAPSNTARPYSQPGQFNAGARPSQAAAPGQFHPQAQPNFNRGGSSGGGHPAPQQHAQAAPHESHGGGGEGHGGEHHR